MKPFVGVTIALALVGLPAAAIAQVTQTYSYDANGRLTGVTTTGSAGTNTAAYVYDDADNRTSRSQTGTAAYATLGPAPGPWQSLTIDTVALALEGSEYVARGGAVEMGQPNCTGAHPSLSRWTPIDSYLEPHGSSASLAWPSLTQNPDGTTNDLTLGFSYNPAGQITGRTVSNQGYVFAPATGAAAYANDGLNRVTTVPTRTGDGGGDELRADVALTHGRSGHAGSISRLPRGPDLAVRMIICAPPVGATRARTSGYGKSPPMLGIRLGRNPLHGI